MGGTNLDVLIIADCEAYTNVAMNTAISELVLDNEVMTVQELVDIVTYLQSEYKFVVPETPYPYY